MKTRPGMVCVCICVTLYYICVSLLYLCLSIYLYFLFQSCFPSHLTLVPRLLQAAREQKLSKVEKSKHWTRIYSAPTCCKIIFLHRSLISWGLTIPLRVVLLIFLSFIWFSLSMQSSTHATHNPTTRIPNSSSLSWKKYFRCQIQKFPICLNFKFWGWVGYSKSQGTPYMWYIFGKSWAKEHQKWWSRVSSTKMSQIHCIQGILSFSLFLFTFRIQGILSCFKNFVRMFQIPNSKWWWWEKLTKVSPWPDVETGNVICAVGLHSLTPSRGHTSNKIHRWWQ